MSLRSDLKRDFVGLGARALGPLLLKKPLLLDKPPAVEELSLKGRQGCQGPDFVEKWAMEVLRNWFQ